MDVAGEGVEEEDDCEGLDGGGGGIVLVCVCVEGWRETYEEDCAEVVYAGEFAAQGVGFVVLFCWRG